MKPQMKEPKWPTTSLPSTLAIIGNSSCCSRMPGDIAVRNSTVSISKRALRSALSMMSIVTVSTSTRAYACELRWTSLAGMTHTFRIDQNVAEAVDVALVTRQDHRRRVHLHDDR